MQNSPTLQIILIIASIIAIIASIYAILEARKSMALAHIQISKHIAEHKLEKQRRAGVTPNNIANATESTPTSTSTQTR